MFKSLIAGATALTLAIGVAGAPNAAKADDRVLRGVLIGAAIGGVAAVIADGIHDNRRHYYGRGYAPRRDVYVVERRGPPRGHGYYGHRPPPRAYHHRDYRHDSHSHWRR